MVDRKGRWLQVQRHLSRLRRFQANRPSGYPERRCSRWSSNQSSPDPDSFINRPDATSILTWRSYGYAWARDRGRLRLEAMALQPGLVLFLTPPRMNDVLDNSHSVAPNRQRTDGSKRAALSSPGGARPTKCSSHLAALTSRTLFRAVRFQGVAAFT